MFCSHTGKGDIAAAESTDRGFTWTPLGVVLTEDWHLSYPFVFEHEGDIFMMPEGSRSGQLKLYRAVDFPNEWEVEQVPSHPCIFWEGGMGSL